MPCDREPTAPHRCADKSSFLTLLNNSDGFRGLLQTKGTFQDLVKLQNKLGNKQSHGVIPIIPYLNPKTSGGGRLLAPSTEQ